MNDYGLRFDMPAPVRSAAGVACDVCGTELERLDGLGVLGVGTMFACHVCPWMNLEPRKPDDREWHGRHTS